MATLGVNIDHIATLRQARGGKEPDPIHAAVLAELAGAHGITAHLREDRRHMQDRDIYLLKQIVSTHLNLEMAPTGEMLHVAIDVTPYIATLVPEKREERTTEGGLIVAGKERDLEKICDQLQESNVAVSLFIDPDIQQIKAAKRIGVSHVELHTGYYANATGQARHDELQKLREMAYAANHNGMHVNAGHGLNYRNVSAVADMEHIEELNIGHSIISRATLAGMETAVRDMLALI
ncbi:MAG: pyridoxine 5'-phosphate synthase [Chitinivibrionales bacterium]|nr:pyridoxine 5'-phosphate synthase [Chitinivibrionales bacterium]